MHSSLRRQDPQLWVQALTYFAACRDGAQSLDQCKKNIAVVLHHIEENNLMPPLMVVQTLAESSFATLSDIKVCSIAQCVLHSCPKLIGQGKCFCMLYILIAKWDLCSTLNYFLYVWCIECATTCVVHVCQLINSLSVYALVICTDFRHIRRLSLCTSCCAILCLSPLAYSHVCTLLQPYIVKHLQRENDQIAKVHTCTYVGM